MTIYINNKQHELPNGATISQVLDQLNLQAAGLAVAVNNNIVAKAKWPELLLSPNDKLSIIRATQGG